MGFSALSQKQHFSLLNGTLRNPTYQPSTQENSDSDAENNIKETDRSSRQIKAARFSWFGGSPSSPPRQESDSSLDTHEKMRSVDDDIELGPISSTTDKISSSQVHLNPQEYSTETNSIASPKPKPSPENHPDTIFKQVTRVLKNTALHDARNLRGQTERLTGWEVNSAHEAKVCYSTFIRSEENAAYIYLLASGTLHLPAIKRSRKGMANPCRLLPCIPIAYLSGRSLQSVRQGQQWRYHSRPNKNDPTQSI